MDRAPLTRRSHARIGLLGNPSDGYYGRTISLTLENYWAEVTLTPTDDGLVTFDPHPLHDPQSFAGLGALSHRVKRNGFYGGLRLLWSTCNEFALYHAARGAELPSRGGFRLAYDTNVPRQSGLSGSSAIVTAALSCLESFYGPGFGVDIPSRPGLALRAESALGITAGLQDRVVQTFTGVVAMDFEEAHVREKGCGRYSPLAPSSLPPLWLIFADNPSDSGAVHSTVRKRWDSGNEEVHELMRQVAALPLAGAEAITRGDAHALAQLMDANFALRRRLFGDAALGAPDLAMVATARQCGAAAKFCGSGGAIVALCPEGEAQEKRLQADCAAAGLQCELVRVHTEAWPSLAVRAGDAADLAWAKELGGGAEAAEELSQLDLAGDANLFLVACDGDARAGFVAGARVTGAHGLTLRLRSLAVAPTWRGRGVAAALLAAAEEGARMAGCASVSLTALVTLEGLDAHTGFVGASGAYEKHLSVA